jgi:phenol 2-monooxygenase
MNVSMMDSYNLAWKLAHSINGLTPQQPGVPDAVLATFSAERVDVARQLIQFDTTFSSRGLQRRFWFHQWMRIAVSAKYDC